MCHEAKMNISVAKLMHAVIVCKDIKYIYPRWEWKDEAKNKFAIYFKNLILDVPKDCVDLYL